MSEQNHEFQEVGTEFEWDSIIEKDSSEFVLLPEGTYDFEVEKYERGRFVGSDKLPPCNKVTVFLKIRAAAGEATLSRDLFLHSITESFLSEFFVCIGQKKKGEKCKMNWPATVGARGRCKVTVREWTGKDGEMRKSNDIKRFCEPDGASTPTTAPAATGFTPGKF